MVVLDLILTPRGVDGSYNKSKVADGTINVLFSQHAVI